MKSIESNSLKNYTKRLMKYSQYLLIGSLWVTFLSCETSVDASDLLEKEQFVVINGYLSPQDTTLKVQISKSKSRAESTITNNADLVISNATVTITDENDNQVTLIYSSTSFSYEIPATDLAILPGRKYFLAVTAEGKDYKSSCVIPSELVENIESEITNNNDVDSFGNKKLKLKIDDIADKRNFYIVGAKVTQAFNSGEDSVTDVDFEFEQFTTDSNRENAVVTVDGIFNEFFDSQSSKANVQVANAEEILYDALRATFLNDYNEDDPFFEPVIAPTNIEGESGFGVFAGYQLTEKEITF
ncbi:DUF4249 domain-containing protein [Aquimarina sp. AU474]|uniref:DUF4249 domain-containing protein n=1 Tax=Aquimarina sp. AU474 TaxID=2108529 RepID=UPI000D691C20|nr:DUF4249 domain-containing protein [Aquimarina sp. AU474]